MRSLLVLSGKGGTGKTTVASALIKLYQAKSFADCDVDAPNLHLVSILNNTPQIENFYGMKKASIDIDSCIKCGICYDNCKFNAIIFNENYYVDQYACEGCAVCEYVCPADSVKMVDSVSGDLILYKDEDKVFSTAELRMGSGNSGLLVTKVKNQLKNNALSSGLAIIDGSPGIGCPVIASITGVDYVLIVAEPSISGLADMKRIVKVARNLEVEVLACVNKFDVNLNISKEIKQYCAKNHIEFLGEIPYDKNALEAVNMGKTIVDIDCPSGQALKEIYENLRLKINENNSSN